MINETHSATHYLQLLLCIDVELKGYSPFLHSIFQEAMRNILLLFSKLNPAIRYVQGMNEVLAPILYVFSTDTNEKNVVSVRPSV